MGSWQIEPRPVCEGKVFLGFGPPICAGARKDSAIQEYSSNLVGLELHDSEADLTNLPTRKLLCDQVPGE